MNTAHQRWAPRQLVIQSKGISQEIVKRGLSHKQHDRACGKWADEKEKKKKFSKHLSHTTEERSESREHSRVRPAVSEPSSWLRKAEL